MTSTLLKLHRTLWVRNLKSNASAVLIPICLLLYGLIGMASLAVLAAADISSDSGTGNFHALTAAPAIGTLAFLVITLIMPSGENQLSARELSALPLRLKDITPALAIASVLNLRAPVPVLLTIAYTVIGSVTLAANAQALLILPFVLGMIFALVLTLVLADLAVYVGATAAELSSTTLKVLGSVAVVLLIFGSNRLSSLMDSDFPLGTMGEVLAWTPMGAPVGWARSLCQGELVAAIAQFLIAVVSLCVAAWAWQRLLRLQYERRPLVAAEHKRSGKAKGISRFSLGSFSYRSPAAMEFTRSFRYIFRDSRLIGSIIMQPILALIFIFQGINSDSELPILGILFLGLFGGLLATNDFGYDGPSLWVKLAAPVRPRTLLYARHWAHLVLSAIVFVILAIVLYILSADKLQSVCFIAAATGIFISSAGLSLLLTTFNPFATARPGGNMWADKSGYSASAFVSAILSLFIGWTPIIPGVIPMALGYGSNSVLLALGFVLVIAVPVVCYIVALRVSGKRVDETLPEIYSKVGHWVS